MEAPQPEPRFCEGCLRGSEIGCFFSAGDIGTGGAIFSDEKSLNSRPHLPQRC